MSNIHVKPQESFQESFSAPQYYSLTLESMNDKRLSRADDHVLAVVSSFFMSTGVSFPTNGWIAERLKISPLTVSRSISKLVKLGYMKSEIIDNRRYLSPPSRIPDPRCEMPHSELVKSRKNSVESYPQGIDQLVKGGIPADQGGVDQLVNHNNKYNNKYNNHISDLKIRVGRQSMARDGLQKMDLATSRPTQDSQESPEIPLTENKAANLQAAAEDGLTSTPPNYKISRRELTFEEEEIWDMVRRWNVHEGAFRNILKTCTLDEIRMAYRDALDANPRNPGAVFVMILQGRWDQAEAKAKAPPETSHRPTPEQLRAAYNPWA